VSASVPVTDEKREEMAPIFVDLLERASAAW
jgi:hypothetical protein